MKETSRQQIFDYRTSSDTCATGGLCFQKPGCVLSHLFAMQSVSKIVSRLYFSLAWLFASHGAFHAATDSGAWSLQSPDRRCSISVTLDQGRLRYQVFRAGQIVLPASPLGLRRADADFSANLTFDRADRPKIQRGKYQLFTGPQPEVNHLVNLRTLNFRNTNGIALAVDRRRSLLDDGAQEILDLQPVKIFHRIDGGEKFCVFLFRQRLARGGVQMTDFSATD